MKKHLHLSVLFTMITCFVLGQTQQQYSFLPKWKVGDKKTATITQHETEYKKGELVTDTTYITKAEFFVVKESEDSYTLKVMYENVAMRAAVNFYEKIGEELKEYKNLELIYSVDKKTGKFNLTNWKEVQHFMNNSIDQIKNVIKKKMPEMAGFVNLAFISVEEAFKNKETIEAYVGESVGYVIFPYDKKFTKGDTLTVKETCPNPFNPADTVTQTTLAYLSNIDVAKKICDINTTDKFDLSGFKEMMKSLMKSMAGAFGADEEAKNKAAKEIESIDFDVTNTAVITFDYGTTWPLKVVQKGRVATNDPRGKTEKLVLITVVLN